MSTNNARGLCNHHRRTMPLCGSFMPASWSREGHHVAFNASKGAHAFLGAWPRPRDASESPHSFSVPSPQPNTCFFPPRSARASPLTGTGRAFLPGIFIPCRRSIGALHHGDDAPQLDSTAQASLCTNRNLLYYTYVEDGAHKGLHRARHASTHAPNMRALSRHGRHRTGPAHWLIC